MTDSLEALRHRVDGAVELQAVVRTMKALSASSITQYENAVAALDSYYDTVALGLVACLKQLPASSAKDVASVTVKPPVAVIVFGSDQGLVGQFNDSLADYVLKKLADISGEKQIWVIGERMRDQLLAAKLPIRDSFNVPGSVEGITGLIGDLLLSTESVWQSGAHSRMVLFHHRPEKISGQYQPRIQPLLPLDDAWYKELREQHWPGPTLTETLGSAPDTLRALIREYLFVSLYQACAESLASENSSRLVAMQRAEKNIEEMLGVLRQNYHHQRQDAIDTELFDVVAGYVDAY